MREEPGARAINQRENNTQIRLLLLHRTAFSSAAAGQLQGCRIRTLLLALFVCWRRSHLYIAGANSAAKPVMNARNFCFSALLHC